MQVVIRGDANEALRLRRRQKEDAEEKERSDDDGTQPLLRLTVHSDL